MAIRLLRGVYPEWDSSVVSLLHNDTKRRARNDTEFRLGDSGG